MAQKYLLQVPQYSFKILVFVSSSNTIHFNFALDFLLLLLPHSSTYFLTLCCFELVYDVIIIIEPLGLGQLGGHFSSIASG